MTDKTIQQIAREHAYERAYADLDRRVLSMQQSAIANNVDPDEVALIGSAYHPLARHIIKMIFLDGEDINTALQVVNRFTSTLTSEFVAAVVKLQDMQGQKLSPRQFIPFVQAVIDDHAGRVDVNISAMMQSAQINGKPVLNDNPTLDPEKVN